LQLKTAGWPALEPVDQPDLPLVRRRLVYSAIGLA
jgi:hypothetical protein